MQLRFIILSNFEACTSRSYYEVFCMKQTETPAEEHIHRNP
jgi:hypothetical protein